MSDDVVAAVLTALGVDVTDPAETLRRAEDSAPLLPPTVSSTTARRPGWPSAGAARPRHGSSSRTAQRWPSASTGTEVLLPSDLPLGWHRLVVSTDDGDVAATLVVVPDPAACRPRPPGVGLAGPALPAALTGARGASATSRTCATLTSWSAGQGAGLVLVNPMHAGPPVPPLDPSPYSPSSRRFRAPQYLRPEATARLPLGAADVRGRRSTPWPPASTRPTRPTASSATRAGRPRSRRSPCSSPSRRPTGWPSSSGSSPTVARRWPGSRCSTPLLRCTVRSWPEWPAELHDPAARRPPGPGRARRPGPAGTAGSSC